MAQEFIPAKAGNTTAPEGSSVHDLVQDLYQSKSLEVWGVCRGEMANTMVEGEGEAGVYDLAKSGSSRGGPIPERLGDFGLVFAKFPEGVGTEGIAERGGFAGGFGLLEYSTV